jgi:sulfonate transport system permease protein
VRKALGRREAFLGLALPLVLLAAWWYATAFGGIKVYQLASPADVVRELGVLWANGELAKNLLASIGRVAFGFAVAVVPAIGIGTSVGLSPRVERIVDPTLQALRAIPSLAWVPLLLLWLGIGETAKIVLIAIGAFFPIYVNLVAGILGVDRKLVEVAEIFGIRGFALARRVVIPAALPSLLVGARVGLTQAWLFLVAAELLGATRGLGFLLTEGQQISRTDEILTAIVLLAICGKLSESGMRAIEKRMLYWTDGIGA